MKRILLSLAAAAIIVSAAALIPTRAHAMSVGTAAAIENALEEMSGVEQAAYRCRWRYGRRVCWWVPGVRVYRPYRYHRPYRHRYRRW